MAEKDKQLKILNDERGTYFFIKFVGCLTGNNILEVRKIFERALIAGHTNIAVDMSEVAFMDSVGLGVIVNVTKRLKSTNGIVALINPNTLVVDTFSVSSVDKIVNLYQNIENADTIFD